MFIQTEQTPNPSTLKFMPESKVLKEGTMEFKNKEEAQNSLLATKLFENDSVKSIFLGTDFITVTKADSYEWEAIKPDILSKIMDFFTSGLPVINSIKKEKKIKSNYNKKDTKIIEQIENLLEEKIKPAVAQDGGDIRFIKFTEGIVYLEMRGSCAGCPSSSLTLKSGVENMLKYYIPEIVSVEAVN
ncbi:MAG: NifU family protein [Rickettsiales bacterium]|nr:NifU family protein [Rickettsiales bacterium]|tara:strand:- start:537 stop:1097 length:561 start_codon:yes stop_codon:yes gene_type:complete